jgi:hypothetical protein
VKPCESAHKVNCLCEKELGQPCEVVRKKQEG